MKGFEFISGKYISGILLISSFAMSGISFTQAASDDFGRLFTTPEERRQLETLRNAKPKVKVEEVPEIFIEENIGEDGSITDRLRNKSGRKV